MSANVFLKKKTLPTEVNSCEHGSGLGRNVGLEEGRVEEGSKENVLKCNTSKQGLFHSLNKHENKHKADWEVITYLNGLSNLLELARNNTYKNKYESLQKREHLQK